MRKSKSKYMIFTFNKNFYNLRAVKNAIKAYRDLADFRTEENKKVIKVIMKNIDQEMEGIIEDEFYNYVLAEMKNE